MREPGGRVIGTFFLEGSGKQPPGVKSPISDEELEETRKSPSSGFSLDEFWRRMREKHGS